MFSKRVNPLNAAQPLTSSTSSIPSFGHGLPKGSTPPLKVIQQQPHQPHLSLPSSPILQAFVFSIYTRHPVIHYLIDILIASFISFAVDSRRCGKLCSQDHLHYLDTSLHNNSPEISSTGTSPQGEDVCLCYANFPITGILQYFNCSRFASLHSFSHCHPHQDGPSTSYSRFRNSCPTVQNAQKNLKIPKILKNMELHVRHSNTHAVLVQKLSGSNNHHSAATSIVKLGHNCSD
jgi:hypothetical protein